MALESPQAFGKATGPRFAPPVLVGTLQGRTPASDVAEVKRFRDQRAPQCRPMTPSNDPTSLPIHLPQVPAPRLLAGQKAIVTGASSGIGRGIAVAMAAAGADVLINYNSSQKGAEETLAAVEAAGGKGVIHRCDVSQEDQVEAMFAHALEAFGRLDILVANSGLQQDANIDDMTLDQWNTVMGVNLTGQFLCARAAVRQYKRQSIDPERSVALGKIICISSVHEFIPWAGHVNYAASKGGVLLFMKSLAQEVAPYRIRVNGIAPGAIRTPINRPAWETAGAYKALMELVPYNRIGEIEDIGRAAVWLASDQSDYCMGISLCVDGGMNLYPEFADGG